MMTTDTVANTDALIGTLYREATRIPPAQYRVWALEQLSRVIEFDAAFWGSGNSADMHFHYACHIGLDDQYAQQLKQTLPINPIKNAVISSLGRPVNMQDVIDDDTFYQSPVYQQLFKPYGIERILAAGHFDHDNGLYSLISLYRFDRQHVFTEQERNLQARLIFHLVNAVSHAFFLHLRVGSALQQTQDHATSAICDRNGCFHEVQPRFVALLNQYFPNRRGVTLPFTIGKDQTTTEINNLAVSFKSLGELVLVTLRLPGPLDSLSRRESQIVEWVCKGLTFKEVGRQLNVAPSTVSNHLYRIYDKVGINSRSELAQLVDSQRAG
ncbi:LuxR C-terminal-related transcriptional regulator [Pseudoalteromonas sp. OOF1S-7]|uniref:helix-turn-helix transcriptional regulator n=1 Tax=Pseudoalteromonas sp. OOF1S-7 TaxID=2917757 RepID=UPI001EF65AF9|nr:LuxR C-terminal-related transcriptional regulator [Pseudoalteromonas sp. OOF1S-7]MCG7537025.1 LuxR C-terminal-related transcriptional regulator [Pseudoalteromonas sp. OOF1S-7]